MRGFLLIALFCIANAIYGSTGETAPDADLRRKWLAERLKGVHQLLFEGNASALLQFDQLIDEIEQTPQIFYEEADYKSWNSRDVSRERVKDMALSKAKVTCYTAGYTRCRFADVFITREVDTWGPGKHYFAKAVIRGSLIPVRELKRVHDLFVEANPAAFARLDTLIDNVERVPRIFYGKGSHKDLSMQIIRPAKWPLVMQRASAMVLATFTAKPSILF